MLDIETNEVQLNAALALVIKKQIPFATSNAINKMSYELRDREQAKLGSYLELRTKWMTKRGAMPVKKSHKNQWPDIHAVLGVKDEIAALNITGGNRPGSTHAVPAKGARKILNPSSGTLTKGKYPSRIIRGRKKYGGSRPFIANTKKGKGVFIRKEGTRELKALYGFKKSVRIDKKWPLDVNASRYVRKTYPVYFNRALDKALDTMR